MNADGRIQAEAFSIGANYWLSRHLRFTANWVIDWFDGSAPLTPSGPVQTPAQRAIAPAQTLSPGRDDAARDHGHWLSEFLLRTAVAL